jgi:hypothetical protein
VYYSMENTVSGQSVEPIQTLWYSLRARYTRIISMGRERKEGRIVCTKLQEAYTAKFHYGLISQLSTYPTMRDPGRCRTTLYTNSIGILECTHAQGPAKLRATRILCSGGEDVRRCRRSRVSQAVLLSSHFKPWLVVGLETLFLWVL